MFLPKKGQKATWDDPRGATRPSHHGQARPAPSVRLGMVRGPLAPALALPPTTASSFPKKHFHLAQTRVLAVLPRDFRSHCSAHLFS